MNKLTKHLFLLMVLWLLPQIINAQKFSTGTFFLTGFPGTSAGNYSATSGKQWDWIDSARAHVTSITLPNPATSRVALDPAHKYGTFNVGDRVLVIQMQTGIGTNTGTYEEAIIKSITIAGELEMDRLQNTFSTKTIPCPDCRVQVIKVHRYYKLSLSIGGGLECHQWDGYTGGVLIFESYRLEFLGGVLNASGKGYFPINRTEGAGGTGGVDDTTQNETGDDTGKYSHYDCDIYPNPPDSIEHYGGRGKKGTKPGIGSLGNPGAFTTGPNVQFPWGSSGTTTMFMGSAGNYPTGKVGGDGGQGGGRGGKGGVGADGTPGNTGEFGNNGGGAGNAGASGRGGGIIMIKTYDVELNPNFIVNTPYLQAYMFVDGENGRNGGNGGDGGKGGRGGQGGRGKMQGGQIYYTGNHGGLGGHGEPGKGAYAGDGGDCGSILFAMGAPTMYCPNCSTYLIPPYDNYTLLNDVITQRNDGLGGKGGSGGKWYKDYPRFTDSNFAVDTPYYWGCETNGSDTVKNICDCENAMRFFLGFDQSFANVQPYGGPYIKWSNLKVGVRDTFIYWGWDGINECYKMERRVRDASGHGTNYFCKMRGIACDYFFVDLIDGNLTRNSTNMNPEVCNVKDNKIRFWDEKDSFAQFFDISGHYWEMNTGSVKRICTEWRCNEVSFRDTTDRDTNYADNGSDGRATSRPDGAGRSGNGTDLKLVNGATAPMPLNDKEAENNAMRAFCKEGVIFVISKKPLKAGTVITLHDMNGREIFNQKLSTESGLQTIDAKHLSAGVYMLRVQNSEIGRKATKLQLN